MSDLRYEHDEQIADALGRRPKDISPATWAECEALFARARYQFNVLATVSLVLVAALVWAVTR